MEEMAQRAGDTNLKDPLGYVRSCALNVLERLASDPQCQRVFDIVCHKCEYVDEMAPQKARHLECRAECLNEIETGFVNAIRKGQLPPGVDARRAAISLHALIDGLIANWVLDPKYHPLAADAENIVDGFLGGLAALKTPPPAKGVKPVKSGRIAETAKTAKPAPPGAKRTRKPEPAAA
jgi:TetR/AcrR family transcriptional regulator, acrAB operon repressor